MCLRTESHEASWMPPYSSQTCDFNRFPRGCQQNVPILIYTPMYQVPSLLAPDFLFEKYNTHLSSKKKETGNWSYLKNGRFGLKLTVFCLKKLQLFHSVECAIAAPKSCQKRQKNWSKYFTWFEVDAKYVYITASVNCVWKQASKSFKKQENTIFEVWKQYDIDIGKDIGNTFPISYFSPWFLYSLSVACSHFHQLMFHSFSNSKRKTPRMPYHHVVPSDSTKVPSSTWLLWGREGCLSEKAKKRSEFWTDQNFMIAKRQIGQMHHRQQVFLISIHSGFYSMPDTLPSYQRVSRIPVALFYHFSLPSI